MLFESQLRHLISNLLIEAKADVLQARHPHIDVHALAALDPSPTKKYLEWMIKIIDKDKTLDIKELGLVIKQFDSAVQRLQGPQRDINTYKSLSDLQAMLKDVGTQSKTQQKQTAKASGSQYVGSIDGWDVYFITSHEAAMLLGKGTKWCITQEDATHWNEYISKVKFFYALRKAPQGDPLDKIAYACYLNTDEMEVFDAQDTSLYLDDRYIIELTNFINQIKAKYKDYVIKGERTYLKVVNDIVIEKVLDDGLGNKHWYKNGRRHREDGPAIEAASGTKKWYIHGLLHREDGPAIVWDDGTKEWFIDDKLHREDGPAVEHADGTKEWWLYHQRHRDNGPAVESERGLKEWWVYGKRHREDGPAIEYPNGDKEWWINGKHHRKDGPAVEEVNGNKEWWVNGKRHREDGPAIEWANGQHKEWYIHGEEYYSQEEYERALEFRKRIYASG